MRCTKLLLIALTLCLFTPGLLLAETERAECCRNFCDDDTWAEGESPEEKYQECLNSSDSTADECLEQRNDDIDECEDTCTAANDTDPSYDDNDHYELACQQYSNEESTDSYTGYGYGYGYGYW